MLVFAELIGPHSTSFMPACPLPLHITATLLETSLARAIHRFVIEDEEEGNNQLVVSSQPIAGIELD